MKILVFSYEYPPFKGGAGSYSCDLACAAVALGHEVQVATIARGGEDAAVDRASPVRIHRMRAWEGDPPWAFRFLLQVYLRFRFDVMLVADRTAQETIARMRRRFFPYTVVVHGTEIWQYFDAGKRSIPAADEALLRGLFVEAKAAIAVSNATRELVRSYLPEVERRLYTVHNCIDVSRLPAAAAEDIAGLRRELELGESQPVVFCLGRLGKDKGQDMLIRAFALVRKEHPPAVLLLGGDGPFREELEALVRELRLEQHVKLLGKISDARLAAAYSLCDAFALTSRCVRRGEGFGLVYLEANCFGKPVVGGDVGGVSEAIEDGVSGLLVDSQDPQSIAAALNRLLADRELRERLGRQGRRRVLEKFTADRMAQATLHVLEQAGIGRNAGKAWPASVRRKLTVLAWMMYSVWFTLAAKVANFARRFRPANPPASSAT